MVFAVSVAQRGCWRGSAAVEPEDNRVVLALVIGFLVHSVINLLGDLTR